MISQINNSSIAGTLANNTSKNTPAKQSVGPTQNDTDKIDQLKESINSGEYKVNISALAKKMADELL
jgi:anti-sigma28 factor (negative regulator of flagellin synthesis)